MFRRIPEIRPSARSLRRLGLAGLVLLLACARPVSAQDSRTAPLTLGHGLVVFGGDATASMSTNPDAPGGFNFTDYSHNALRVVRLGVSAAVKPNHHLALLAEIRSENADTLTPYALYLRIRPWEDRAFDIQAGRIPPVFGAFSRRAYAVDNPLIGYPLAYQYLTSIRPDAVPRDAGDLMATRGRGSLAQYPVGEDHPEPGLPMISAFRWDTGVQVRVGSSPIEVSGAITTGTLSDPRVRDNNRGKQVSARLAVTPVVGFIAGVSVARGAYLSRTLNQVLPAGTRAEDFLQRAWGLDAEYSRDYWLVRAEAVTVNWDVPAIGTPAIDAPLTARALSIEGRYKLWPGAFVAARLDGMTFSDIRTSRSAASWDAPVRRIELGGGQLLRRNAVVKLSYQHNRRDTRTPETLDIGAVQLQVWF